MTKNESIASLELGLQTRCLDDIIRVLCNLEDGTCDYLELIPLLKKVAEQEWFYFCDDNGAGGFPRPSGQPVSYKEGALKAIENIKENSQFETSSVIAENLKSNHTNFIKAALLSLSESDSSDESLIPILKKIAKKDEYHSYSYLNGFGKPERLGALAQKVIDLINRNIEKNKS